MSIYIYLITDKYQYMYLCETMVLLTTKHVPPVHAFQAVKDREEARPQVPTPPPVGEPRVAKMVKLWPEIPMLQALKVTL